MNNSWKVMAMLVMSAVFCLTGNIRAEPNPTVEGSYSIGIYDKYIGQWSGYLFDERPSMQGDVTFSFSGGFYATVWFAKNIGEISTNDLNGDEIDFTLGWAGETLGLSIDTGLTYYDIVPVLNGSSNNIWALYMKVSKTYSISETEVSPFLRAELNIPDHNSSFNGGTLLSIGMDVKAPLSKKVNLCVSSHLTHDSGTCSGEENVICGLSASLQFEVGGGTLILPSFLMTKPLKDDPCRDTETCLGISWKGNF